MDRRGLFELRVLAAARLADLTHRRSRAFGITATIHATEDYVEATGLDMSSSMSYAMTRQNSLSEGALVPSATLTRQAIESRTAERIVSDALSILKLTQEDLAAALKVSPRTIRRWQAGGHVPQKESRGELQDLQRFLYLLARTVPPDVAPTWVRTPLSRFKGRTPLVMLQEGRLGELLGLVAAVDSGAFL